MTGGTIAARSGTKLGISAQVTGNFTSGAGVRVVQTRTYSPTPETEETFVVLPAPRYTVVRTV
jgi:hypothetical protein